MRRRLRRGFALALLLALVAAVLSLASRARLERAEFVFNNGGEITSLDPAAVSGQAEGRVASALFEGLTVKDPATLAPLPGVAEAWELTPDGLSYTFHLRANARWSNGEKLVADDFVWSWRRLLEPATAAPYAYQLYCVRGARAFASASDSAKHDELWKSVGLHASDARTLVVELEHPTAYFLALTSSPALFPVHRRSLEHAQELFPERWQSEWIKPGHLISNGPFKLRDRRVNDRLRLAKNPEYWDADSVAMQTIDVLAVEQLGTMLNLYLAGEVDWIDRVPTNLVPRLAGRADFRPAPYLASYFYRFNTRKKPYDDARVRRALALAVDRRALCEQILKKGEHPSWSLTPLGLDGYPRPEMAHAPLAADLSDYAAALEQDRTEARALLAAAGFGAQHPFPPLELHYNTSEAHRDIAEVIAAGWSNALGLDVRLLNQEWKVYLDTQKSLGFDVSRSSWIGDYPDANSFLEAFTGASENNRTGWGNARYDALVGEAGRERDPARRAALLADAERILLAELPILPLYSYVSQNLVSPRLGGFHANVLDEHPPKFWYWKSADELAAEKTNTERADAAAGAPASPASASPAHESPQRGKRVPGGARR